MTPAGEVWSSAELASPAERAEAWSKAVPERIEVAFDRAPLYGELWERAGVLVGGSPPTEVASLPLVDKEMVREHRERTGDLFGGLASPLVAGSVMSRSTGTSGRPTYFHATPADVETMTDIVASYLWASGARPGSKLLLPGVGGGGTRGDLPVLEGVRAVGGVLMTGSPFDAAGIAQMLEDVGPEVVLVTQALVDGLRVVASERGTTLESLFQSTSAVLYAAKHLTVPGRRLLERDLGTKVYEMGGVGDLALWGGECVAQRGMHIRDDLFLVETLDASSGEPLEPGSTGELVYTSLWDEAMNYVRWRSEDIGSVDVSGCACGRTTGRLVIIGRLADEVFAGDRRFFPQEVEDALCSAVDRADVFFQIGRDRDSRQAVGIRVALPEGVDEDALRTGLSDALDIDLPMTSCDRDELLAGQPWYKFRQVVDV